MMRGGIMGRSILNMDSFLSSDVAKVEEDGVDLTYGNLQSAQRFWTVVLLTAIRDYATSVQFRLSLGEDCLSLTVARVDYSLVPPDAELRDWLLHVARNLAAGSVWKGLLWSWKTSVLRCRSRGSLTVFCGGHRIQWKGIFGREGIVFQRRLEPNELDSAIACYTKHIWRSPDYAASYGARGWAYLMKGDVDNAITDCTDAIRLDPCSAANYYNRACAYRNKGQKDKAEGDFMLADRLGDKE
jgi:tetratricopeptide (TPR) repeat protein